MGSEQHFDQTILEDILKSYDSIPGIGPCDGIDLPKPAAVSELVYGIRDLLFPGYFDGSSCTHLAELTHSRLLILNKKLLNLLFQCPSKNQSKDAQKIASEFFKVIPKLRECLRKDITALDAGDPAARSELEILLAYPGFTAIMMYRIAHFFFVAQVPLLPRMITELAHTLTGIDIHPGAKIGDYFCIDHGTGIVIGETTEIGNNVKLYQGVTLGALSVLKSDSCSKRHPSIQDHVTIYAHATILGGDTVIGHHSIIGGNVWITESVQPHSKIYFANTGRQITRSNRSEN